MKHSHKHADLIHAWADGAQIQYKDEFNNSGWVDDEHPEWFEYVEYRIKPEPRLTTGYRRYVINIAEQNEVYLVHECKDASPVESTIGFVCWIDKEWQYHELEE